MTECNFEQISIRLWPSRALTVQQEDQLLQQWEQLLQARAVDHGEIHLHTQITDMEGLDIFSAEDVVNLVACALDLEHVAMIDLYGIRSDTEAEIAFRVHLDHPPIRQLCELYRRRVVDPWQTLTCLQRINLTEGTYAKGADPLPA